MDCSPPGSSVRGISQARILEWVAIFFSRRPFWPRDWTLISCIGRWILYHWATWEAHKRITQTAILLFSIYFSWGWSWFLSPVKCHKAPSIVHQALYQLFSLKSISYFHCIVIVKVKSLSRVGLFATPETDYQVLLSMRFSRQEYWSRLPFPSPAWNCRQYQSLHILFFPYTYIPLIKFIN